METLSSFQHKLEILQFRGILLTSTTMNSPSKELIGKVSGATQRDQYNILLEWAKLFLGLPISVTDCEPLYSSKSVIKDNFRVWDDEEPHILMTFHLDVDPGRADTCCHLVIVWVYMDGTAHISDDVSRGGQRFYPPFLEGYSLGFKGTWEEVLRKMVELNDLVMSQIPEVPEDLK